MPALPPVPAVVKVSVGFSYSGNTRCMLRFFMHYSGTAPTNAQLNTFCTAVGTAWSSNFVSVTSGDVIGQSVKAEDLSSNTGAIGQATFSATGTRTGDGLPKATCAVNAYNIARRYRGGKPKTFYPFGTSTDLTGTGQWKGTSITAFNTAVGNFNGAVAAAGWTGAGTLTNVNVSYYSGFTVVTNPVTHRARNVPTLRGTPLVDTILTGAIDVNVGSQRRRNAS